MLLNFLKLFLIDWMFNYQLTFNVLFQFFSKNKELCELMHFRRKQFVFERLTVKPNQCISHHNIKKVSQIYECY